MVINMKKVVSIILCLYLSILFGVFVFASGTPVLSLTYTPTSNIYYITYSEAGFNRSYIYEFSSESLSSYSFSYNGNDEHLTINKLDSDAEPLYFVRTRLSDNRHGNSTLVEFYDNESITNIALVYSPYFSNINLLNYSNSYTVLFGQSENSYYIPDDPPDDPSDDSSDDPLSNFNILFNSINSWIVNLIITITENSILILTLGIFTVGAVIALSLRIIRS